MDCRIPSSGRSSSGVLGTKVPHDGSYSRSERPKTTSRKPITEKSRARAGKNAKPAQPSPSYRQTTTDGVALYARKGGVL